MYLNDYGVSHLRARCITWSARDLKVPWFLAHGPHCSKVRLSLSSLFILQEFHPELLHHGLLCVLGFLPSLS